MQPYHKIRKLGSGSECTAYLAQFPDGQLIVVKEYRTLYNLYEFCGEDDNKKEGIRDGLLDRINRIQSYDLPFAEVVEHNLYEDADDVECWIIIQEYVPGKMLHDCQLTPKQRKQYTELIKKGKKNGFSDLHEQNVMLGYEDNELVIVDCL